ncbi:hypothetical protein CCUG60884_00305 [Mycobacteroides salmoniphilum]|uniref:Uncharacterized protein n=1 Tax=Mycobacteroides salmoniphilum TaxID=404941 RepID=A0A4R8T059_9MYCO|nr:hypothetical protein CCUG60884_00305 [Mycobacteroides salmoniphilum]
MSAAWTHDIGYASALARSNFHPVDGADYLVAEEGQRFPAGLANLVAHHTGAVFEAQVRGLADELARHRFPVDVVDLAILNTADLSTSPEGQPVKPQARIAEILDRYAPDSPVYQAVSRSAPILLAQASLVLAAARAAPVYSVTVPAPERVDCIQPGPQWRAIWSGDYHQLTARGSAAGITQHRGVAAKFTNAPDIWDPADAEYIAKDLRSAAVAARGDRLGWLQYRAFPVAAVDGRPYRDADEDSLTSEGATETFCFGDILERQLALAMQGRSILVQQRTFHSLDNVTDWVHLPISVIDAPIDLRTGISY